MNRQSERMRKDKTPIFNAAVLAGLNFNTRETRGYSQSQIDMAVQAGHTADLIALMGGPERVSYLIGGVKLTSAQIESLYDTPAHTSLLVSLVGGTLQVCQHIESRPTQISRRLVRGRQPSAG